MEKWTRYLTALALTFSTLLASTAALADDAAKKPADESVKQPEKASAEPKKPQAKQPAKPKEQVKKAAAQPKPAQPKAKASQPAKKEDAKPALKTHTVKAERFKLAVKLSGVFESGAALPIVVRPKAWSELVVKKLATQSKLVKKGEVIVEFDTERIDLAIEAGERARALSDLEFQLAEQSLKFSEKAVPLDLASYERIAKEAQHDLDYFLKTSKAFSKRAADQSLRSTANYLAYAQEELKQLEKMYAADDLTEETEEIILRRQRDTVERLKFSVENSKLNRDNSINVSLPRLEASLRQAATLAKMRLESARKRLPAQLNQARISFAKLKRDRELAAAKLAKLKKDRQAMTIRAPFDGIVYYGAMNNGRWSISQTLPPRLKPAGVIKPHEVFMTLVRPRPLYVRAYVKESDVRHVRKGVQGRVVPTAFPNRSIKAKVNGITVVPVAPGRFDTRLELELDKDDRVLPGMTCTATLLAIDKPKALTVPASAVHSDPGNVDQKVVYVKKGNKKEKRTVELGETSGGKTEVLKGLKAGETVYLKS